MRKLLPWALLLLVGLAGSAYMWVITQQNASLLSQLNNARDRATMANATINELNKQLNQQAQHYEQTQQQLSETVAKRDALAHATQQLRAQLHSASHCMAMPLPDAVAQQLFEYRDSHASKDDNATRTQHSQGMDNATASAQHRPTFADYIAEAEQFFARCNDDRAQLAEWGKHL